MQPYCDNIIVSIKIPYVRKDTSSTLLTISAAAIALVLMLASPVLPLSNILLQPAQAQTLLSFRTTEPATNKDPNTGQEYTLTFDAQGTTSSSNPQSGSITNGTFQISSKQGGNIITSGHISGGRFSNSSSGLTFAMASTVNTDKGGVSHYVIDTACSTSRDNGISIYINGEFVSSYTGPVECSTLGGDTTNQQEPSSSMAAGSSQDGDRDGIPDSSDRCTHNSDKRCFKEDITTQQQQQQPSSSSSGTGNQTNQ